jgi:hypothetical protein
MITQYRWLTPDRCTDNANECDELIREPDEAVREFADIRRRDHTGVTETDLQGALQAVDALLEDNA